MKGVFSCSPVLPTIEEIETCECIDLTSAEEWKPKPDVLEEHKKAHQDEQPKKFWQQDDIPITSIITLF